MTVDVGAAQGLAAGERLVAAGVRQVDGAFERGDTVSIVDEGGNELARGLVAYDAADARKIAGCRSAEIEELLGYAPRAAMVHRDDLAMR